MNFLKRLAGPYGLSGTVNVGVYKLDYTAMVTLWPVDAHLQLHLHA